MKEEKRSLKVMVWIEEIKVKYNDVKVQVHKEKEVISEDWDFVIYLWWRSFKCCVCAILFFLYKE